MRVERLDPTVFVDALALAGGPFSDAFPRAPQPVPGEICLIARDAEGVGGALTLRKLDLDSEVFGAPVARIDRAIATSEATFRALYAAAAATASSEGFRQLVRRIAAARFSEMWALVAAGFRPVDIGVTLSHRLAAADLPTAPRGPSVRLATDEDIAELSERLKDVYRTSYFYVDPFYAPDRADELHRRWLRNCYRGGLADVIFVAHLDGRPVGYCACSVDKGTRHGSIPLVAVDPVHQGRGIGRAVLASALEWFAENAKEARVRTQASNYAAVALYEGVGFRLIHTDMTLSCAL